MELPGTAAPWLVLGVVLGILVPVLAGLAVVALRRRAAYAPPVPPPPPALTDDDADVLDDGSVPLARVLPGHQENGREVPPRIVVYRRPLEIRAHDRDDLADLVRDVVVDQVAVLLGRDPEEIDPTG